MAAPTRILHPWPDAKLAAKHPAQEQCAAVAHYMCFATIALPNGLG